MKKYNKVTPEGTKDLLLEECLIHREIERRLGEVFSSRGFHEVVTPGLEFMDVFEPEVSGISPEVMYKTTDRRGRLIAMRPDSTMPIARLAATRILPGQLERLKGLAQRMADEPDPEKGALMDQQFHMLLCEASGNLLLRSLFRAMVATVNRFIGTMYVRIVGDEDQARQLHDAHLEIVQALAEGDENAAIQGIWRHFQVVEEAILTMP